MKVIKGEKVMFFRYRITPSHFTMTGYRLWIEYKTPGSRKWKDFSHHDLADICNYITNQEIVDYDKACQNVVKVIKSYDSIDEFVITYIKKDFWNIMNEKDTTNNETQAFKFLQNISSWRWSKSIEIDMDVLKGVKNE